MAGSQGTERPRGRPRASADPRGPLDEWLQGLSPTAVHIIDAARRLLVTQGYDAVTLESVALEASVDRATLRHHFLSKAGLLQAVFDRLQIDAYDALIDRIKDSPSREKRLHDYVGGLGALIADPEAARGLFELAPHGLRDTVLREKFASLYAWYRHTTLEDGGLGAFGAAAGRGGTGDPEARRRIEMLAALIIAAIDGLSFQVALDKDSVDADLAFGLLAGMIARELAEPTGAVETREKARRP